MLEMSRPVKMYHWETNSTWETRGDDGRNYIFLSHATRKLNFVDVFKISKIEGDDSCVVYVMSRSNVPRAQLLRKRGVQPNKKLPLYHKERFEKKL